MPSRFLTRSVDLLGPDGRLQDLGLSELALSQPTVLIARERCRFELFQSPAGLSASAAVAAARINGQARAPYDQPGGCVTRRGNQFGLWWWDQSWALEQLAAAGVPANARILPEAFAQPEAEGWRIVKGVSGYEAQAWREGLLIGSSWRRRPFDTQSWSAFTRIHEHAGLPAVEAPPPAQALPYTWRSAYRRRLLPAGPGEGAAPLAAMVTAMLLIGVTALFAGQGLRMQQEHARVTRELAFVQSRPRFSQRPRLNAEAQKLQALQSAAARPDPVVLVEQAQRILRPFNLKVSAFEATSGEVTVTVPAEAVAGIDLLTEELESSPYFTNVRPSLDRAKRQLVLRMSVKGAPAPSPRIG